MTLLVDEGRPIVAGGESDRIGRGPWSRLLASAVVRDEASSLAESGRALARDGSVHGVSVGTGQISGVVDGQRVALAAEPLPPRVWAAVVRSGRGNAPLEAAFAGRAQSVHLEHLLTVDWERSLVPRGEALHRSCTCGERPVCRHVAALGYALAHAIDRDPSLLLCWRGCGAEPGPEPAPAAPAPAAAAVESGDAWEAGPLPEPRPLRPLPVGAVLRCLGPSGVQVGGGDLADVLQRAYAAFAGARS